MGCYRSQDGVYRPRVGPMQCASARVSYSNVFSGAPSRVVASITRLPQLKQA